MKGIHTKFEIEGIGPHETKLTFDEILKSNQVAIFARNGSGKSFIGRVFRLVARIGWKVLHGKSDGSEVLQKNEAYTLLSVGHRVGRMEFSQQCDGDAAKAFTADVSVGPDGAEKVVLQWMQDCIFRVFNQEYVEGNVKEHKFELHSGRMSKGWVIGETNIQIDNLQSELRVLNAREEEFRAKFADAGKECATRLNLKYKVTKNTGIFKQLFSEDSFSIGADVDTVGVREFAVVAEKLSTLASIPDDLPDVNYLNECVRPTELLEEISVFLSTVVPKSTMAGAEIEVIKDSRDFFEQGLRLSVRDAQHCPFCRQKLTDAAIKILEQYKTFLAGAEAKAAKKAAYLKDQIQACFSKVQSLRNSLQEQQSQILTVGRYFDSVSELLIGIPAPPAVDDDLVSKLVVLIKRKAQDPSVCITLPDELKTSIENNISGVEWIRKEYDRRARIINAKKMSTTKDRLALRIELVKAAFVELKRTLHEDVANWMALKNEIKDKQNVLDHLLGGNRELRQELVFATASALINELFGNKYSLRKEDFVLQFRGVADPNRPISTILSDGEKSAISLCYFLAETHLFVDKKQDYKKLFFVLDDPVSSMDTQFVYAISNLFKRLDHVFPEMKNVPKRYWIFTHSMDFYAMLIRNNVCKEGFVLYDGAFTKIREEMLLPFEAHLADIARVADAIDNPTHTTGNSVRHVLEVLAKFEQPLKNIDQFVSEENDLMGNPNVLPFANDYSHGAFQSNQVSIGPIITSVCKTVVEYVQKRYPGQIAAVRKNYMPHPSTLTA